MANKQFLDYEGLLTLWAKIKSADDTNTRLIADLQKQVDEMPSDYSKIDDIVIDGDYLKLSVAGEAIGMGVSISSIIKDGMLDDIEIVEASEDFPINGVTTGKFIKFTWNVAAGSKSEYLAISDLCDYDHINSELGLLKTKISTIDGKLGELESEFEILIDTVQSNSDSVNNQLSSLSSELGIAKSDIEQLKAVTGNIKFEDIEKDETGKYVGDSEIAPTTSSVVSALNELKEMIPEMDDFYTKKEVYSKTEVDTMFDDVEEVIDVISSDDINNLNFGKL